MSQSRRGVHWTPALMNVYVYTYIFDVMKIVYSILHAMRAIVCNAHEGENTVRRYILISTQNRLYRLRTACFVPYTSAEMFQDLRKSIWNDLRGGKRPDLNQRALQKVYVNSLTAMLEKPKTNANQYMPDSLSEASAIARGQLTDLRRDLANAASASGGIYRSHYLNLKALIDTAFETK